jgi:hypothetical protein
MRAVAPGQVGSWAGRRAAGARLALAALLLTALLGPAPLAARAGTPYSFAWPNIMPAQAAPGGAVELAISAQARGADGLATLTFAITAIAPDGAAQEVIRFPNQRFGAWQVRRYAVSWTVPDDQPAGETALLFLLLDAGGAEVARWQTALPVLPGPGGPPPPVAGEAPAPDAPAPDVADRPPRRCAAEFQIVGSERFVARIRAHLAYIYRVAPEDYEMVMTCQETVDATRITRIVQAGPPYSDKRGAYSDFSGTIWLRDAAGPAAASLLVHEAAHINRTGWNRPGDPDCTPEDQALEWQARFVDRAAAATLDLSERDHLTWLAGWYRAQKGVHNCPAR